MSSVQTGPDSGFIGHTSQWKKQLPTSFRSPFYCEGDLGFFSYRSRKYGIFFLALQTFTRQIFAVRIPNTKAESIYQAISTMLKVTHTQQVQSLNFFFYFTGASMLSHPRPKVAPSQFGLPVTFGREWLSIDAPVKLKKNSSSGVSCVVPFLLCVQRIKDFPILCLEPTVHALQGPSVRWRIVA